MQTSKSNNNENGNDIGCNNDYIQNDDDDYDHDNVDDDEINTPTYDDNNNYHCYDITVATRAMLWAQ